MKLKSLFILAVATVIISGNINLNAGDKETCENTPGADWVKSERPPYCQDNQPRTPRAECVIRYRCNCPQGKTWLNGKCISNEEACKIQCSINRPAGYSGARINPNGSCGCY